MADVPNKVYQITDNQVDVAENGENLLATVTPFSLIEDRADRVKIVISAMRQTNWSTPCFVRLPNGDLMVARFPMEDEYEMVSEIERKTREKSNG